MLHIVLIDGRREGERAGQRGGGEEVDEKGRGWRSGPRGIDAPESASRRNCSAVNTYGTMKTTR